MRFGHHKYIGRFASLVLTAWLAFPSANASPQATCAGLFTSADLHSYAINLPLTPEQKLSVIEINRIEERLVAGFPVDRIVVTVTPRLAIEEMHELQRRLNELKKRLQEIPYTDRMPIFGNANLREMRKWIRHSQTDLKIGIEKATAGSFNLPDWNLLGNKMIMTAEILLKIRNFDSLSDVHTSHFVEFNLTDSEEGRKVQYHGGVFLFSPASLGVRFFNEISDRRVFPIGISLDLISYDGNQDQRPITYAAHDIAHAYLLEVRRAYMYAQHLDEKSLLQKLQDFHQKLDLEFMSRDEKSRAHLALMRFFLNRELSLPLVSDAINFYAAEESSGTDVQEAITSILKRIRERLDRPNDLGELLSASQYDESLGREILEKYFYTKDSTQVLSPREPK
jgi:hypothetical protein